MYPADGRLWFLVVLNLVWLLGLTILVWKNRLFLQKLFPGKGSGFKDKLEEVLAEVAELEDFKKKSLDHLQKVVLVRYNPYHDTGGDQSFSACILDGKSNGLIITSLHSRVGTRVFAKPIKDGKEDDFPLSEEEKEVLKKALN